MRRDHERRTIADRVSIDGPRPRWSRRSLIASGAAVATAAVVSRPVAASRPPAGTTPVIPGYASAELAVEAYLDALSAADFDAAVEVFAIEPYVEHFDFRASLERVRSYGQFSMPLPLPSTDPFNVAINLEQRRAAVAGQVLNQYFTLVNPTLDRTSTQPLTDDAAIDAFATTFEAAMTSGPLADLATHEFVSFEEIDADSAEAHSDERTAELDAALLAIVGADESTEVAVRSSVLDRDVVLLFRVVRYGDAWTIETLGGLFSTILGISANAAGTLETGDVDLSSVDSAEDEATSTTTT